MAEWAVRTELGDLDDVRLGDPPVADADVALVYDDVAERWVPGTVATSGGGTVTWRGAWDAATGYVVDDVVGHDGSSWVAVAASTGDEPPSVSWELIAAQGDVGPEGPQGDAGPQGDPGEGVPPGGTAGQVLAKTSTTDFDTAWADPAEGGGGFDPDVPLVYFTMVDADGVLWTVTVGTDGALNTVSFTPRATEAGDTRVTAAGDVRILEG